VKGLSPFSSKLGRRCHSQVKRTKVRQRLPFLFSQALTSQVGIRILRKDKILDWLGFKGTNKVYSAYPAVKIARFGVRKEFKRQNIGTHTINMIKKMFVTHNRTGCRFITVDAYNEADVLPFYQHNDFQFFSEKDKNKNQRAMFFDLKRLDINKL
jgi:GNAT superfamily N-acetyltransferase